MIHLHITTTPRMPKPTRTVGPLLHTKAEAVEWFRGMWHGLAMGALVGAVVATAVAKGWA